MTITSGIYEFRNKITGHCYVGSSVNVAGRKREHLNALRKGKHHSRHLQRAWDKYGEDTFEFLVIEEVVDRLQLIRREQFWIETRHPRYNMNPAATNRLGTITSEETKARLRKYNLRPEVVAKKKAELTGHSVAPETVELIKAARAKQETTEGMLQGLAIGWGLSGEKKATRRGRKNTKEQNQKIAESHAGMKHKPESLEKMRLAKLGKMQSAELVERRIQASWGSKTEEEKAAIIAKRKATIAAKQNQLPEIS